MIRRIQRAGSPFLPASSLGDCAGRGGLVLLAQLVVLTLSLGKISSTRNHVAANAKAERALALTHPLADEAAPALDRAFSLARLARPTLRDGTELLAPLSDRGRALSVQRRSLRRLRRIDENASGSGVLGR